MATLPTPEENARTVLRIFKTFGRRPGEVLMPNNLLAIATQEGLRSDDINQGLEYGYEKGWFEAGPNGSIKLTASGFDEMA